MRDCRESGYWHTVPFEEPAGASPLLWVERSQSLLSRVGSALSPASDECLKTLKAAWPVAPPRDRAQ
jgi:hypothetical protein